MPGNFDDFVVQVDCPACRRETAAPYGTLRYDPRVECACGLRFAVFLAGSPVEEADRLFDARSAAVNDNSTAPMLVKG